MVELKVLGRDNPNEDKTQLFSYLKLVKCDIGVLICHDIYVYFYDYAKDDDDQSFIKIPFEKDNTNGAKFIELFSRDNFDKNKIKEFIKSKTIKDKNINEIKELLTSEYVKDLIVKDLKNGYKNDEIEEALKEFNISINQKVKVLPSVSNYTYIKEHMPKHYSMGAPVYGDTNNKVKALRLLYGLREEGKITDEMLRLLQDKYASNQFFKLGYKVLESDENNLFKAGLYRYYKNDPIIINGTRYWICSQWSPSTKPYRDDFAKKYDIDLESDKYDHHFQR